jgi:acetyl-CoA C-acetyltransferase
LGATAIRAAVERAGIDPAEIDEVLMGQVVQAGVGQAPARQAAILAGIPATVGATTVNKVCGSGMKAVMLACQAIRAGDADLIVAGGMENMNLAPYLLPRARSGYRLGHGQLIDGLIHDGLWCPFEDWHMGNAAEHIAESYDVSREHQDLFAYESHRRAMQAIESGAFRAEIVPVEVTDQRGRVTVVDTDEAPRRDTTPEALAALRPAFRAEGSVTPGNSPGITDGAAALVVASRRKADSLGKAPLARILGCAQAGVEPKQIFIAPVVAVRRLLDITELRLEEFDLIEINEAFAAQVLADGSQLAGWDWDKVNMRGGAIALGHPIGASGARILVTLLHALRDTGGRLGLATACLGGGEAVAMAVRMRG